MFQAGSRIFVVSENEALSLAEACRTEPCRTLNGHGIASCEIPPQGAS